MFGVGIVMFGVGVVMLVVLVLLCVYCSNGCDVLVFVMYWYCHVL